MKNKSVSRKTRSLFMRTFLDVSRKYSSPTIALHLPEVAELRARSDFNQVLDVLIGLGLLSTTKEKGSVRYVITPDGACYFERLADEKWRLIVHSVLIPIAVAIVTTIVTNSILPPVSAQVTRWLSAMQARILLWTAESVPTDDPSQNPETDPISAIPDTTESQPTVP